MLSFQKSGNFFILKNDYINSGDSKKQGSFAHKNRVLFEFLLNSKKLESKLGLLIEMTKIREYSLFLISFRNHLNEILNFGIKRNEIF